MLRAGADFLDALDGQRDTIECGGERDLVLADPIDASAAAASSWPGRRSAAARHRLRSLRQDRRHGAQRLRLRAVRPRRDQHARGADAVDAGGGNDVVVGGRAGTSSSAERAATGSSPATEPGIASAAARSSTRLSPTGWTSSGVASGSSGGEERPRLASTEAGGSTMRSVGGLAVALALCCTPAGPAPSAACDLRDRLGRIASSLVGGVAALGLRSPETARRSRSSAATRRARASGSSTATGPASARSSRAREPIASWADFPIVWSPAGDAVAYTTLETGSCRPGTCQTTHVVLADVRDGSTRERASQARGCTGTRRDGGWWGLRQRARSVRRARVDLLHTCRRWGCSADRGRAGRPRGAGTRRRQNRVHGYGWKPRRRQPADPLRPCARRSGVLHRWGAHLVARQSAHRLRDCRGRALHDPDLGWATATCRALR